MRKFAFDWGGSLENNESLRQIARDLHKAGYEVHIVPACGASWVFPYEQALKSLDIPYHGIHLVLHEGTEPDPQWIANEKVKVMHRIGCSILYDDNHHNLKAVAEAGLEAILVTKENVIPRPSELL